MGKDTAYNLPPWFRPHPIVVTLGYLIFLPSLSMKQQQQRSYPLSSACCQPNTRHGSSLPIFTAQEVDAVNSHILQVRRQRWERLSRAGL